jgi:hypothetical protein
MTTLPVACTLSADEVRCAAELLLPGLARAASSVTRLPDGVRMEFDAAPAGIVARIADVVERERRCCRFLHFTLDVPAASGTITLVIGGPEGTGTFLDSLAPEFARA